MHETIKKNYAKLKHIHVNLSSGDNYPHIGLMEFCHFARHAKILDDTIEQQTIDRMFIACKVGGPPGASYQQLYRYEFLELLVRIADQKYQVTGRAKTYNDALKALLKGVFESYERSPWQEFRDDHLWVKEVNNVL